MVRAAESPSQTARELGQWRCQASLIRTIYNQLLSRRLACKNDALTFFPLSYYFSFGFWAAREEISITLYEGFCRLQEGSNNKKDIQRKIVSGLLQPTSQFEQVKSASGVVRSNHSQRALGRDFPLGRLAELRYTSSRIMAKFNDHECFDKLPGDTWIRDRFDLDVDRLESTWIDFNLLESTKV